MKSLLELPKTPMKACHMRVLEDKNVSEYAVEPRDEPVPWGCIHQAAATAGDGREEVGRRVGVSVDSSSCTDLHRDQSFDHLPSFPSLLAAMTHDVKYKECEEMYLLLIVTGKWRKSYIACMFTKLAQKDV